MQDSYKEVIIVLIAGTFVLLTFAGVVIFILLFYQRKKLRHKQELGELKGQMEKEMLRAQLETREESFRLVSEELHDNVAQLLGSAELMLGGLERALPQPVPEMLAHAQSLLAQASTDIRALSRSLSGEWLSHFSLIENLRLETERINTGDGRIQIELLAPGIQVPLSSEHQVMAFRIVQEALQNCMRHSGASRVEVLIGAEGQQVHIRIKDNGKGLKAQNGSRQGLGMINMQRRTGFLAGDIRWDSQEGRGDCRAHFSSGQIVTT